MGTLRWLTCGESHGPGLTVILEGLPAGLPLSSAAIDAELARRQKGYGRGGRQRIETDRVRFLGGVRFGETLGAPVGLAIENLDHASWTDVMPAEGERTDARAVRVPRPGHADLPGGLKYDRRDLRDILERASARETAARVAAGACARALLEQLGVELVSRVVAIGGVRDATDAAAIPTETFRARTEASPVRAIAPEAEAAMCARIDEAMRLRDTLGGVFEVRARGLAPGLGSHVHADRRLDARVAAAFVSIQAIKGVELGDGVAVAESLGSEAHDEIVHEHGALRRLTNRAGGIEGGMTNGEDVVVRAYMKPLSTVPRRLRSVDWQTGEAAPAHVERTDTCAVPAAAVIGEAMLALVLADAVLERLGGDTLAEVRDRWRGLSRKPSWWSPASPERDQET